VLLAGILVFESVHCGFAGQHPCVDFVPLHIYRWAAFVHSVVPFLAPIREELRHHRLLGKSLALSERFRRQVRPLADTLLTSSLLLAVLLAGSVSSAQSTPAADPAPAKLRTETVLAFDRYLHLTEERNDTELERGSALLWVDALPESQRTVASAALKRSEVEIHQLNTLDNGKPIVCPGGLIHHWVGVVFIPGAKLDDVLGVLEDYDRQSTYYAPDVERSKIESREGQHFRVFLRFRRHKVITVVLDTEHDVHYFRDAPGRAHSRSSTIRIAEVENPGRSNEREKQPGQDGGYLWRMETWWRMEERDGGVYVQSEVASLTRDIPTGLGWLVGPFVTSIPKETLLFTLESTRRAVVDRARNSAARFGFASK